MHVVAGVTGNTGSVVAATLVEGGERVRGLTREAGRQGPAGVEMMTAALDDVAALTKAFAGADGAYILCPSDVQHPDPMALYVSTATAVAEAARATGLRRLVLLSSIGAHLADGTGPVRGLYDAERILAGVAPEVVFLRPGSFAENWRGVLPIAREQGVLPTFYTDLDAPVPTTATRDIGWTAAALLLDPTPPAVVELSGPADVSANDAARAFGQVLGRPVHPVQPPRDTWPQVLAASGVGPAYAALLVEMYDGINSGHMRFEGVPDQRRGQVTIADAVAAWA